MRTLYKQVVKFNITYISSDEREKGLSDLRKSCTVKFVENINISIISSLCENVKLDLMTYYDGPNVIHKIYYQGITHFQTKYRLTIYLSSIDILRRICFTVYEQPCGTQLNPRDWMPVYVGYQNKHLSFSVRCCLNRMAAAGPSTDPISLAFCK